MTCSVLLIATFVTVIPAVFMLLTSSPCVVMGCVLTALKIIVAHEVRFIMDSWVEEKV